MTVSQISADCCSEDKLSNFKSRKVLNYLHNAERIPCAPFGLEQGFFQSFFSLNISLFRSINGGHFLRKWHEGSINTAELTVRMIAKLSKVKYVSFFNYFDLGEKKPTQTVTTRKRHSGC